MKIGKIIKKFFLGVLGIVFFAFAISITFLLLNYNKYGVTEISDTSIVIIKKGISSENFNKNDVVLVRKMALSDISVGEEIFAYKVAEDGSVTIDLSKVDEIHLKDDALTLENGNTYATKFIIGEAYKTYGKVGLYLSIIESTWGFLVIVLVPSFVILIYEIYELIVEIKYGKNESEN